MNELVTLAESTMKADFAVMLIFFAFLAGVAIGLALMPLTIAIISKLGGDNNSSESRPDARPAAAQSKGAAQ